ncbi:hypothetical protein [Methanoculleus oceani]|uniref:hypothetical protein n=1 Tax=Methanoculleus oceani TaxID=2184756 RepID=UPI002033E45D|nr:hypothetical protein [Methanoculleus sp. CWC-02]
MEKRSKGEDTLAQRIAGMGFSASGIVGVLILAGIFLSATGVSQMVGQIAIGSGVIIGIVLGILGIVGVASRYC